ncbi:MAG: apolipoprotein N-acyltransferase [Sphingomonadaceae bacterium]|nr:apolipoprotein N-acyltransferase [Sphingomonadaceae bacterium]
MACAAPIASARPFLWTGLTALLLGAMSACGFQPLGLWPLTIIAVAAFLDLAARARTRWQAFLLGWLLGVSHFTIGNNWVATAFTYQAEMPQWLGGIAVVVMALYLALFPALATLASWQLAAMGMKRPITGSLPWFGLTFAGFWIFAEWMRGWVFTGFAWNPLGIALLGPFDAQGLALTAKWIGTYGLSGLLVAISALLRRLVVLGISGTARQRLTLAAGGLPVAAVLAALMVFPAQYIERREGAVPFTLIQPDLRQKVIGDPWYYEVNFQKMSRLTVPIVPRTKRVVFWPESGLADYLRDGYPRYLYRARNYGADPVLARKRVGNVVGPYSLLLTGAVDLVIKDGKSVAARNTVTALDSNGSLLASYSKAHLVPFGEYLPLRELLEPIGLRRLVAGSLDFWPGPGPRTFDFGRWGKAGVQICYEIIFSGNVVDPHSRPDYIFNPSNDGWFGDWGPPQHLAQARLRAIEEGLPVLRSTTTGISAVIDADGIVRDFVPRHQQGRIDGVIPPPHRPTLFARFGNAIPVTLATLILLLCAVALRRFDV